MWTPSAVVAPSEVSRKRMIAGVALPVEKVGRATAKARPAESPERESIVAYEPPPLRDTSVRKKSALACVLRRLMFVTVQVVLPGTVKAGEVAAVSLLFG